MMRSILLAVLFSVSIFAAGNTCTLRDAGSGAACHSKTCALSAIAADTTHANWSGTGCTASGYVPSSDYIVIPDTFNLTANQPWIIGNYGLPVYGYVYGVTGLPSGGFSGSCTATFSGGTVSYLNNAAGATCTIAGGNVSTVTITNPGTYFDATAPTISFTGSGGGSGAGTVQFIGGSGVAALNLNATGVLNISGAVTVRGSIIYSAGDSNTADSIIGLPGGSLIFDSSGAADPTDMRYSFTGTYFWGYRAFHAEGTSSQHFTVTSQAGGGNGFFNSIGVNNYCCSVIAAYTDFSNLGDPLFYSISAGSGDTYDVEHSTFTAASPILAVCSATSIVRHDYNVHSASTGAADVTLLGTGAVTSGTREAIGNVFSAFFQNNAGVSGTTITGNYFGGSWWINSGYTDPWASFSGNFERIVNPLGTAVNSAGDVSNSYFYWDYDYYNPHWGSVWTATGYTAASWSGVVFDVGGDTGGGDGNTLMHNRSGSNTISVTNTITTPDAGSLSSSSSLANPFYGASTSGTWTMNHNTLIVSDGTGGQGAVQVENSEAGAGQVAAMKSNIVWGNASLIPGYNPAPSAVTIGSPTAFKYYDSMGTQTDVISPANGDYNVGWQSLTGDNGTGFAHSGNGYVGKFSATPGTHDLSVNPRFADATRNLMTFDYYYLGHHYSDWQTSHSYSVGDTVTHVPTDASGRMFFAGASINYRCILVHTSDTTNEPGAARYHGVDLTWIPASSRGSVWRTYWEPASLYQLRQGVAAQTKITDGAIGCVACGIIDALRAWVFTGYTPTNPAIWCAGHDGEAIGATPFCGKGKALIAALGVM
jgi:hypothetical protein